jgi:AcrR family transcriptional regulator
MARKKGLDLDAILVVAEEIIDRDGWQALSLASLAAHLDIKSPSLYAHFNGLDGLRDALALRGARAMGDAIRAASKSSNGMVAVRAIAHAYRRFAKQHPGLYAAIQRGVPLEAEGELARAQYAIIEIVIATIAQMGASGSEAIHIVRAMRSSLHGFVMLERDGGFALADDVDVSFERLVDMMIDGISKERSARLARAIPEI